MYLQCFLSCVPCQVQAQCLSCIASPVFVSVFVLTQLPSVRAGLVHDMAVNEWSHSLLCTALSLVDDTSIMVKTIGAELKVSKVEPCRFHEQSAWIRIHRVCEPSKPRSTPSCPHNEHHHTLGCLQHIMHLASEGDVYVCPACLHCEPMTQIPQSHALFRVTTNKPTKPEPPLNYLCVNTGSVLYNCLLVMTIVTASRQIWGRKSPHQADLRKQPDLDRNAR